MFAGSPRSHKGLELLLDSIEQIGRKDLKLLIAGATNDQHDAYEQQLREKGGEYLYMLKQTSLNELPAVLSMADMVVLPQMQTPAAQAQMPSKLFDAMSMALPIVATAVSDIPEVLANGCGLVVKPGDKKGLANAICEVLESSTLGGKIGGNARRTLIEKYSIDAAQERVDEIIKMVTGE
jgi:glycosyltransferase involved in cell wall biosynthesis